MPNGRPTTPETLRQAKGTLQKCRINTNAVQVNGNVLLDKLPKPPKDLPAQWKKFYTMVAQELLTLNLLSTQNTFIVYRYTKYAKAWYESSEKLGTNYVTTMQTVQGAKIPMVSPYLTVMRQMEKEMKTVESEFGFTPAARSRIIGNVAGVNREEDEFENL